MLKTASVSEQETAEKTADYTLKQANVEAARANVQRLEDLKNFDRVTAPFDGTVTMRNTDIGQLIAADSGPELFRMAQTNPLRVYVRVPQPLVHAIAPGQKAELTFQELPGRSSRPRSRAPPARWTRSRARCRWNCRCPIRAAKFSPAATRRCASTKPPTRTALTLSDNALIFRAQGMQVAVVGGDNKVQLRSVKLGRDFGNIVGSADRLGGERPRHHQPAGLHCRRHDGANRATGGNQFGEMKNFVFICVLAAGLAGCAVGPDYHRAAALPGQPLPQKFQRQ